MIWSPDPQLEHLVTVTITHRREAMAKRQQQEKGKLDASLAARGLFNSGMRLACPDTKSSTLTFTWQQQSGQQRFVLR